MHPVEHDEPRTVGRYHLRSLLGEGGAANTYLADDPATGERFALKELRLIKTSNSKQIELFERECAILRELDHPQIPRFIDNVVERRAETISLYLVQELIEGQSLQQMLDRGHRFTARQTVRVMKSCLEPLTYLHASNPPLFHRDIKPSNIILRPDGECVLVDFGAVREAILDDRSRGSSVVGTFGYMAPEQFQARAYPSTDLYGLAATALHLLTGIEPGRFPLRRLKPELDAFLSTDAHLTAILDILLEPAAEDRYGSATALANALERWEATHGDDPESDQLTPIWQPAVQSAEGAPSNVSVDPTAGVASNEPLSLSADAGPESGPSSPTDATDDSAESPGMDAEADEASAKAESAGQPSGSAADASGSAERGAEPSGAPAGGPSEPGAPPDSAASPEPGAPPAQQLSAGGRSPVGVERAPLSEAFVPGRQGARDGGPLVALLGAAAAAVGLLGQIEYNRGSWIVIGAVLLAYGLVLALTPRRPAGRSTRAARSGETVDVEVRRIIKRVAPLGRPEWEVEFGYLGSDELHYVNRFRLANAKAAREVAEDPTRLRARFAAHDPADSVLVSRR